MALMPINSNSSGIEVSNTVNGVIKELQGMQVVQSFKDDSGTRRVILGRLGNDEYGMKVSQPGIDVFTATDNQLVFNSNYNMPKIVASGTTSITATAGNSITNYVDISSLNLASAPLILCMTKTPNSSITFHTMPYSLNTSSSTLYVLASSWVDQDNIVFQVDLGSSASGYAGEWTFRYYAFVETAES